VRLLSGVPESSALAALRFVTERSNGGDELFASHWVVAEAYYVLQYHYRASKKDTLAALRGFFMTSGVQGSRELLDVLSTARLASVKPGFVDRVIHRAYLRSGMDEMATFEKAAAKLPKVRVLAA
jgi:predicted nucleic-acid-binding protein